MVYGDDNAEDRAQAEDLHGAPGVTLYPVSGLSNHSTYRHAIDAGILYDLLRGDMSDLGAMAPRPESGDNRTGTDHRGPEPAAARE